MAATAHALQHYDVYCKPIYGDVWPSIRIALQCPPKHCALLNNFVHEEDIQEIRTSLQMEGAVDFMDTARSRAELGDYAKKSEGLNTVQQHRLSDEALQMSEAHLAALEDTDTVQVPLGKDPQLYDFMPVKRVLSEQRRMELEDVRQSVFLDTMAELEPIEDEPLVIPKHLQVFTHARGDVQEFPHPARTSSGPSNYQVLDAGALLPVLALDLKPGCTVLDMCAAPGIKAFTMLQTFLPDHMTLIDVRSSRIGSVREMLSQYLPYDYMERVNMVVADAALYLKDLYRNDNVLFDKVLVDVPCYNDRSAVTYDNNNIFAAHRKRERLEIQPAQDELLYWGIKSCKPGGTVVYCTSTLSPPQNDGTIQRVLHRLLEEANIEVAIYDTSHYAHLFRSTMNFFPGCRFGQQVIPNLTANYGPTYFCKIKRIS